MRLTFATTVAYLANVTLSVKVKCYRIDKMSSVRLKPRAAQVSSQAYGNVKRCSASLPKPRVHQYLVHALREDELMYTQGDSDVILFDIYVS